MHLQYLCSCAAREWEQRQVGFESAAIMLLCWRSSCRSLTASGLPRSRYEYYDIVGIPTTLDLPMHCNADKSNHVATTEPKREGYSLLDVAACKPRYSSIARDTV
jgi:hypothetical protein